MTVKKLQKNTHTHTHTITHGKKSKPVLLIHAQCPTLHERPPTLRELFNTTGLSTVTLIPLCVSETPVLAREPYNTNKMYITTL